MNTTNETSATRAADPASVFIGSTLDTSTGSVAFGVLEKGEGRMHLLSFGGSLTANPNYPVNAEPAAEAEETAPVASGPDWFEIAGLALVAEGHISENRFRAALEVARQAVSRG